MKSYSILFAALFIVGVINANAALYTCPAVHPNYPNEKPPRGLFDGGLFMVKDNHTYLFCLYKNVSPTRKDFPQGANVVGGKWKEEESGAMTQDKGYSCEAWTNKEPLPSPNDCPVMEEGSPIPLKK